jgi:hypothetical protein
MWSLTSPLAKRISGLKKFCSSAQKDFSTLSALNRHLCFANVRFAPEEVIPQLLSRELDLSRRQRPDGAPRDTETAPWTPSFEAISEAILERPNYFGEFGRKATIPPIMSPVRIKEG